VAADLDNDGWPELYVANDAWANFLFHNLTQDEPNGLIRLEEVAHEWGTAVNADGVPQASMGLACADFDRNGFLDLAVSNFNLEYTTLYVNNGDQFFVDSSHRLGLVAISHTTVGWGLGFVDYDNDGWLDLFVANGHLNRFEHNLPPYEMKAHLLHNDRGQRLTDISAGSGPYFSQPVIGRGMALGDFDNDGRADIAVVHHHQAASLLRNETSTTNSSITLQFVGNVSNRDGINTRLRIWLTPEQPGDEPTMLMRELVSGDSYLSSNDRRICVGLGRGGVLRGEVQWPSGQVQTFGELEAGGRWRVIEGTTPQLRMVPL
jgi:hypothetical protein